MTDGLTVHRMVRCEACFQPVVDAPETVVKVTATRTHKKAGQVHSTARLHLSFHPECAEKTRDALIDVLKRREQ